MSNLNLRNFWQSIKSDKYLLIALFLGLALRGLNPTFGSPALYVSNDEAIAHLSAYNMIAEKSIHSIANYTPLGAYIQIPFLIGSFIAMRVLGLIANIPDFELFVLTHEGYFLFIPRLISALFGVLSILVIYKITLELFDKKHIAILAAILAAVSFNLVHISNTGRPWSVLLFFATLAIYFALKKRGGLSLFFCAIGFGFHQGSILVLPMLFLLNKSWNFSYFLKIVFFLITILILNSLVVTHGFLESIKNNQSFLLSDRFLTDFIVGNKNLFNSAVVTLNSNLSIYYLKNFFVTDAVVTFFGILGLTLTYTKSSRFKLFALFALSYFIFASLFFHPLIRYLLPLFILLIPFASYVINRLIKLPFLIVLILIFASVNSIWWNSIYIKEPTFVSAQEWVKSNLSDSVPIAYTGGRFYYFLPTESAIDYMRNYSSNSFERLNNIGQFNSENKRDIIFLNKIPGVNKIEKLKNAYKAYGITCVIDYYLDPKESIYSNNPSSFTLIKRFNPTKNGTLEGIAEPLFDPSSNFDTFESRPNSSMFSLKTIGPYFDVLKINQFVFTKMK